MENWDFFNIFVNRVISKRYGRKKLAGFVIGGGDSKKVYFLGNIS